MARALGTAGKAKGKRPAKEPPGTLFRAVAAAVLCAVFPLFPAAASEMEPEPVPVDILVRYMDDYVFSDLGELRKIRPNWPLRVDFLGDVRLNQKVSRLDGDVTVWIGGLGVPAARAAERFLWIKRIIADTARRTGLNITVETAAEARESADILVLTGDGRGDTRQKYREELAKLTGALNGAGGMKDITAVFTSSKSQLGGCSFAGAVDKSHVIRSGVLVINNDYKEIGWENCFIRGMLRFSGMLGGALKFLSVTGWTGFQSGLNGHEKHVLSALYSPRIKNGMARADALRITEKAHRP